MVLIHNVTVGPDGVVRGIRLKRGVFNRIVVTRVAAAMELLSASAFARDSSFPLPGVSALIKQAAERRDADNSITGWRVFGHADVTGQDEHNKALSERRARVFHAILVGDIEAFHAVAKQEPWGDDVYQALLRNLGCVPGAIDGEVGPMTRRAIAEFRRLYDEGFFVSRYSTPEPTPVGAGEAFDEPTRRALREVLHADLSGGAAVIDPARFVGPDEGISGCSEFNVRSDEHADNRRVSLAIFHVEPPLPNEAPCVLGDVSACPLDRTEGLRCSFFREAAEDAPELPAEFAAFTDFDWTPTPGDDVHLSALTTLPDSDDVEFSVGRWVDEQPPEAFDSTDERPRPQLGESLGKVSGQIRQGVAFARWSPPEGFDPFDGRAWFAAGESEHRGDIVRIEPPVFIVSSGDAFGVSAPPGWRADGTLLEGAVTPVVVTLSSGRILVAKDGAALLEHVGRGDRIIAAHFLGAPVEDDRG